MMKAKEVKAWILAIPDEADIAVDDGGLCLVLVGDKLGADIDASEFEDWIEVGGVPLTEDEEE